MHEQGRMLADFEASRETNAKLAAEIEELRGELYRAKMDGQERESARAAVQAAINDKDAIYHQTKKMLARYVAEFQKQQRQIEDLQRERTAFMSRLTELSAVRDSAEFAESEERMSASQSLDELENKNRKLQELLQKSNDLYAALVTENKKLLKEREVFMRPHQFVVSRFAVFDVDQTGLSGRANSGRVSRSAKREAKLVKSAYLRKVLLEFFSQKAEDDRGTLVPVILGLVGCTEEQVSVVMRHWQRNQCLIAKTSGFFGFW
jgi:hypothetical protein